MSKANKVEPWLIPLSSQEQLDKRIYEAAKQLLGNDMVNDYPHRRFVLLCAARAEYEMEAVTDFDPELRWGHIARNVYELAASREKDYYGFPHLLSEAPTALDWQREMYQATMGNLVVTNTDQSPEAHWGQDFAEQVAGEGVQTRYV